MSNEEIISALRNAVEHGDTLQSAVQIMINSGYDYNEVQEASKYVGGAPTIPEPKPEEQLVMPEEKKNFSSKLKFWKKNKSQQHPMENMTPQQPIQQIIHQQTTPQLPQNTQQITQEQIKQSFKQPFRQSTQQIFQQPIKKSTPYPTQQPPRQQVPRQVPRQTPQIRPRPGALSREIKKIKPTRQGYTKEIILLIILLILIGFLAATIIFKDKILAWFA